MIASPDVTRIGWIGTGVMGGSMCGHLLAAGYEVTVSTRTRAKAEPLLAAGATWARTPAEVGGRSDLVFTMVGEPDDVREVVLGADGALEGVAPGSVLVDMTTSEPALAIEIAEAASTAGVGSLDAPVSGGDVGARNATLSIMVGGRTEDFESVRPCFQAMGSTVVWQGPAGAGQHAKLVNQTLVASTMVGVCEALLYAHRTGLDPVAVLESVSGGAAGSWALANLAPRILAGDMSPGFRVDHFVKDMGIALAEARRARLSMPGLALAHQLYVALQAHGRGTEGTQALIHALSALSAVEWTSI